MKNQKENMEKKTKIKELNEAIHERISMRLVELNRLSERERYNTSAVCRELNDYDYQKYSKQISEGREIPLSDIIDIANNLDCSVDYLLGTERNGEQDSSTPKSLDRIIMDLVEYDGLQCCGGGIGLDFESENNNSIITIHNKEKIKKVLSNYDEVRKAFIHLPEKSIQFVIKDVFSRVYDTFDIKTETTHDEKDGHIIVTVTDIERKPFAEK